MHISRYSRFWREYDASLRRYPIEIPQAQKISERKPADSLDSLPIEGSSKPVMGPNNYDD